MAISRTFRLPKVVLNIITVYEENQSTTRVVSGGNSCFLIGRLNGSVLLPFLLVFRDCQPALKKTGISIIIFLLFPPKSHYLIME